MLVVINLVAGFQTLGTLMAVGLMMLPAVSSRLWHDTLPAQLVNASAQAMLASVAGLLLSYHLDTPSGPTIIGCAGRAVLRLAAGRARRLAAARVGQHAPGGLNAPRAFLVRFFASFLPLKVTS